MGDVPTREHPWGQFAEEIGGVFYTAKSNSWRHVPPERVVAMVKQWTITLDAVEHDSIAHWLGGGTPGVGRGGGSAQMRAAFISKDGFRFRIGIRTMIGGLVKLLGMQEIRISYPDFDRQYVIRSNDESKVRALFANPRIRELIELIPPRDMDTFEVNHWEKAPEEALQLQFYLRYWLKSDVERLKSLYDLFVETLSELVRMGPASEQAPPVAMH
jgi:hypothetical protein